MKTIMVLLMASVSTWAGDPADSPIGTARHVVAAVILAESGGHGRKGMAAVYEVIHARATGRGTTCLFEVKRAKQFSCLNKTTPELLWIKMKSHAEYNWVHDVLLKFVPITAHTGTNPYNRCKHYHAVTVMPKWSRGKKPFATFGGHHWYNNVK